MKLARVAPIIGIILIAYLSLCFYFIAQQNVEELLICVDKGGLKIPYAKRLCSKYLFAFRGTQQDIEALHHGTGASFVVQGQSSVAERAQVLHYLISKGLDVNHVDMHQLLPLHAAVLANAADETELLLRHGANPNLNDAKFGLTPLALALKLQREDKPTVNRQPVIALLKSAS